MICTVYELIYFFLNCRTRRIYQFGKRNDRYFHPEFCGHYLNMIYCLFQTFLHLSSTVLHLTLLEIQLFNSNVHNLSNISSIFKITHQKCSIWILENANTMYVMTPQKGVTLNGGTMSRTAWRYVKYGKVLSMSEQSSSEIIPCCPTFTTLLH